MNIGDKLSSYNRVKKSSKLYLDRVMKELAQLEAKQGFQRGKSLKPAQDIFKSDLINSTSIQLPLKIRKKAPQRAHHSTSSILVEVSSSMIGPISDKSQGKDSLPSIQEEKQYDSLKQVPFNDFDSYTEDLKGKCPAKLIINNESNAVSDEPTP